MTVEVFLEGRHGSILSNYLISLRKNHVALCALSSKKVHVPAKFICLKTTCYQKSPCIKTGNVCESRCRLLRYYWATGHNGNCWQKSDPSKFSRKIYKNLVGYKEILSEGARFASLTCVGTWPLHLRMPGRYTDQLNYLLGDI